MISFSRLNTLQFHEIYISVKVVLKTSSLFCTDVVLNKANALRKKGVIEQMEFTINIQNGSIDQKTLTSLKNTLNILNK